MEWWSAHPALFYGPITLLLALLVAGAAATARNIAQARREDPTVGAVRSLQSAWRVPILKDEALARRIAEITSAPLVKRNYRLQLTVTEGKDEDDSDLDDETMKLHVEARFDFVNVTPQEFRLAFEQPFETKELWVGVSGAPKITVDGESLLPLQTSGAGALQFELDLQPYQNRAVTIQLEMRDRLPFLAEFPQTLVVAPGAKIVVSCALHEKVALRVTGDDEASWYEDFRLAEGKGPDRTTVMRQPLLPGQSILLSVGI